MGDSMKVCRFGTVMTAMVAMLMMTLGVAVAQEGDYGDDVDFGVSITPENPVAGDTVTGSIVGAVADEVLEWTAAYNPVIDSGTVTADADGNATFTFEVPQEAIGQDIVITIVGAESGTTTTTSAEPVADDDDAEEPVDEVTAEDDSDALPDTGANTTMLLLGSLLLLMVGGGAVATARRKKATVDA